MIRQKLPPCQAANKANEGTPMQKVYLLTANLLANQNKALYAK